MANPLEDDPFAADEEYTRQAATAAGHALATEQERENRRKRNEANARFGSAGPRRRFMAGARQVAGSMPLVRRIPAVERFANPQADTPEGQDLADYRLGSPGSARVGEFIGGGAPYAGAASMLPRLFGTLPGAIAGNVAIGAGDAKLDPQGNPLSRALIEALGTTGAWGLGRALTPRSNLTSGIGHAERAKQRQAATENLIDDAAGTQTDALNTALAELRGFSPTTGAPITRGGTEAASRRIDADAATTEQATRDIMSPPLTIPNIPDDVSLRDMAFWGAIGAGAGHLSGNNSILGGAAGVLIPEVRSAGIRGANRMIDSLNSSFGTSRAGRMTREAIFRYFNNRVLSDADRALLHALGGPTLSEFNEGPMGSKREQ